jgi:hypothetical protein
VRNFRIVVVRLCLAGAACAVFYTAVVALLAYLQANARAVHPSEQRIANKIRELGGAYHPDKRNGRHITGVWLQDTPTTDADLALVLTLPYLTHLDVQNTAVTDASLDAIFAHNSIKHLDVAGTSISKSGLAAAMKRWGNHTLFIWHDVGPD